MKMIVNTCKNKIIEEKRRQKRQEKIATVRLNQFDAGDFKSIDTEKSELIERLKKNIESLPEKYRAPIWLVLFENIPYAEASLVLSLPEKTIRTQVARGLERLRQAMSTFGSTFSVIALSELIKEVKLEKSPQSIYEMIHSPKTFQLAENMPRLPTASRSSQFLSSLKIIAVIGATIIISIIALNYFDFFKSNLEVINKEQVKVTKPVPLNLALDFDKKDAILPYLHLGKFHFLEKGGLNKSGCIEISKTKLILKFSVKNVQFPLKLTYRSNTKILKDENLSGTLIGWSSWSKMSMLYDFSKPKLVPFSNGESYPFELDKDWEDNVVWITKNTIDIWCFGKRMNLYILDHNENDDELFLYVLNNTKIDNLTLESIDPSLVPDVSSFIKINDEVSKSTSEEIISIKKYFNNLEDDINPKLQQYKSMNEDELLNAMKIMIQPK